jgi:hypothetical protein
MNSRSLRKSVSSLTSKLLIVAAVALMFSSAQAQQSQTRSVSFEYDANTGMLFKETAESGALDQVQTVVGYDGYGNKTSVAVTARTMVLGAGDGVWVNQTRTTSSVYEAGKGRYPVSLTNASNHTETMQFDARWGSPYVRLVVISNIQLG